MNDKELQDCGAFLAEMRQSERPIGELPQSMRPATESEAYRIQDSLHARLASTAIGDVAGYKIGCTTQVMQQYLGIDQPCRGAMYAGRLAHGRADISLGTYRRLGVECEVAVRLARDLPPDASNSNPADLVGACDAWFASIEIVEDRYEDYESLGAPTLIADDFFHAACVVGPAIPPTAEFDVCAETGRLIINGEEVGQGHGRDILGHPLAALLWLAGNLAEAERGLYAGDIVTLGSVVKTVWIDRPARVEARFDTLGSAFVDFLP